MCLLEPDGLVLPSATVSESFEDWSLYLDFPQDMNTGKLPSVGDFSLKTLDLLNRAPDDIQWLSATQCRLLFEGYAAASDPLYLDYTKGINPFETDVSAEEYDSWTDMVVSAV